MGHLKTISLIGSSLRMERSGTRTRCSLRSILYPLWAPLPMTISMAIKGQTLSPADLAMTSCRGARAMILICLASATGRTPFMNGRTQTTALTLFSLVSAYRPGTSRLPAVAMNCDLASTVPATALRPGCGLNKVMVRDAQLTRWFLPTEQSGTRVKSRR